MHGCFDELLELLDRLEYAVTLEADRYSVRPPDYRKVVFVGDLVDLGPGTPEVLRLVSVMIEAEQAFCVSGNHDVKLVKALKGRNLQLMHGLADFIAPLEKESPEFRQQMAKFLDGLISHYVLDDGKLVVAHAGLKESMQGRGSAAVY